MDTIINFFTEHLFSVVIFLFFVAMVALFRVLNPIRPCKECGEKTCSTDDKGNHLCGSCESKIFHKMTKDKNDALLAKEKKIQCPKDGHGMVKEFIFPEKEKIIIDRCPHCKSIFLDAGELERIQKIVEDESSSSGDGNFTSGLVVGMVLG